MSRIPKAVAAEVIERANGQCEACASAVVWPIRPLQFHHRQARAMGGSNRDQDTAANLLLVHPSCHTYIHANPDWARSVGYIVSQYAGTPDAGLVPVVSYGEAET